VKIHNRPQSKLPLASAHLRYKLNATEATIDEISNLLPIAVQTKSPVIFSSQIIREESKTHNKEKWLSIDLYLKAQNIRFKVEHNIIDPPEEIELPQPCSEWRVAFDFHIDTLLAELTVEKRPLPAVLKTSIPLKALNYIHQLDLKTTFDTKSLLTPLLQSDPVPIVACA